MLVAQPWTPHVFPLPTFIRSTVSILLLFLSSTLEGWLVQRKQRRTQGKHGELQDQTLGIRTVRGGGKK